MARIVPNFGCDILPECLFLQQKFEVNKKWKHLEVKNTNGVRIAVGEAFKHDNTWLFYVATKPIVRGQSSEHTSLTKENPAPKLSIPMIDIPTCYCNMDVNYDAEQEELTMLPIYNATRALRAEFVLHTGEMSPEEYLKEHIKLGHRNSRDVATIVGRKLPKNLPACTICLQANSKRHPLSKRDWPIHEAPRPGYAWAWDHCGPFKRRTWGGNNILSLKVDLYSGKLVPKMVNTTGNVVEEWAQHVTQLEAQNARQVVARLVTDSAPYFVADERLRNFNIQKGIVHVNTPPYTQELDPCERTIQTLLAMTRTAMLGSGAPDAAYGECIMAMATTLNALPHHTGGKLTRLEKYNQRLMPGQHRHLVPWGCRALLHVNHGERGQQVSTLHEVGKLKPKAIECIIVGYDPNGLGYRVWIPNSGNKIATSLHVTPVTNEFPWRASPRTLLLYLQMWICSLNHLLTLMT